MTVKVEVFSKPAQLPDWLSTDALAIFLHTQMAPYHDSLTDTQRGVEMALGIAPGHGGFVAIAEEAHRLYGALVMLKTGMRGFIPENLLLFVAVVDSRRGQGLGRRLIETALSHCHGDVKLHVEPENPAKRLYERMGFIHKYDDLRFACRRKKATP